MVAFSVLLKVIRHGQSLSQLKTEFLALDDSRDRALANEITNGVLRWRWRLEARLTPHLKKPLKAKDTDIHIIMLIALYELLEMNTPDYAIVNEAVLLVKKTKKLWAKGLVNAVLRNVIRENGSSVNQTEAIEYSHPQWMLETIKNDWPEHWQEIAKANNQRSPIWLRVNQRFNTADEYQQKLNSQTTSFSRHPFLKEAIKLESKINITDLPDFQQGAVSVQDAGAQFAAHILKVQPHERVLDLCAAPGGKTCHILELTDNNAELVAVDNVESRMSRVQENMARLNLKAKLITGDASENVEWWDGELFDCILLDAPCSASGVIRRHPDIKSLRREEDIKPLVDLQQKILNQAWAMLAKGGRLLYVTCSVFKQENQQQLIQFMAAQTDAIEINMDLKAGVQCEVGCQLLPGVHDMDGFYYAYLSKKN